MELHDYQVYAAAHQAEMLRNLRKAELRGQTEPATTRWQRTHIRRRPAGPRSAIDFQPGQ